MTISKTLNKPENLSTNKNLLNVILETTYAEYGSALEMLSACKNSEKDSFCFGFFHHAKDEYNHVDIFLSILKKYGNMSSHKLARDYRFSSTAILVKGYVSEKGYLVENLRLKDFIAYIYTNELLAKESFEGILKLLNSSEEDKNKIIKIMDDELRHHGLAKKHFIKYYPLLQPWHLKFYKIRETIKNKGRKFYYKNLEFLDLILSPLYKFMGFLAANIIRCINLVEFCHTGKNLMEISPKSII